VVCARAAISQFNAHTNEDMMEQLKGFYCFAHYNDKVEEYKIPHNKRESHDDEPVEKTKKKRVDLDNNKDITRIEVYRKGLLIAALELPKSN
jgi:hypothetical protein